MGLFADELRAGMGEAARKLAEARLAGDHFSAEAYRERLRYLRCIATCHGVEASAEPADPGGAGEGLR
jgi:hypothetical protein